MRLATGKILQSQDSFIFFPLSDFGMSPAWGACGMMPGMMGMRPGMPGMAGNPMMMQMMMMNMMNMHLALKKHGKINIRETKNGR